jgi:hypothetical protein
MTKNAKLVTRQRPILKNIEFKRSSKFELSWVVQLLKNILK